MRYRTLIPKVLVAGVAALWAAASPAQVDTEVNAGIQFNFTTPGARSLALGGAFVGRADDATAAFTNPAGLVNLSQRQVSVEGRRFAYRHRFVDRGHALGFVSGIGVDAIDGLRTSEIKDEVGSLSFLSFVQPWAGGPLFDHEEDSASGTRTRWAVAVYRHELVRFEAGFRTQGAFYDFFDRGVRTTARLRPLDAAMDLEITNVGAAAALRLTRGLALGLGVSYYDFAIDSLQQRFDARERDLLTGLPLTPEELAATGAFFGPPDDSLRNEVNFQQQRGSDSDLALNLGLFWQHKKEKISLGAVYRQGPRFEFTAVNRRGGSAEVFGLERGAVLAEQTARFHVPDVLGVGLAVQAGPRVRVTVDYNRVEYSALTADMVSVFGVFRPSQQEALDALAIDDGDEVRIGLEYAFDRGIYVRVGAWYDPDHRIRFAAEPGLDSDSREKAVLFQPGDDVVHATGGIGFAFGRFKLDAALDLADTFDTTSLSLVYLFGK